ncbi:Uncharacterised protein [Mycobacteroides abscessus subsp. abscessus]|nr:Uncharacterised protein [Mycobacteroides abscessus subsp. abscessus]
MEPRVLALRRISTSRPRRSRTHPRLLRTTGDLWADSSAEAATDIAAGATTDSPGVSNVRIVSISRRKSTQSAHSTCRYGLIRIWFGFQSPLCTCEPYSICAGWASTMVSSLRSEPQSRPQSLDR